jgi:hypothetical protein
MLRAEICIIGTHFFTALVSVSEEVRSRCHVRQSVARDLQAEQAGASADLADLAQILPHQVRRFSILIYYMFCLKMESQFLIA